MKKTIQFKLNNKAVKVSIDENRSLLWVLRTDLGISGTKFGCGEGYCGSCVVLLNDKPVQSCSVLMRNVENKSVITIEGLAENGKLHPVQQAFIEHDALQCGFCTPGMIMNAVGLLKKNPTPNRQQIIEGMNDNLCRCASYMRIIDAIQTASVAMKGAK